MAITNKFADWELSLTEFEQGGFGSTTRTFRVPTQYKKYYTVLDNQGKEVYNKDLAFQELATTIQNAIIHRYKEPLLTADLFQKAYLLGNPVNPINASDINIKVKIVKNILLDPEPNSKIYFGNLAVGEIDSVSKDTTDTTGQTWNITLKNSLGTDIDISTQVLIESDEAYIYMEHTRNNTKAALYKAMQFASQNREIWQIIKDSSFSGPNWSFSDQTTKRVLSNDILGIDANTILETAELNEYKVEEKNGLKSIFYKKQLLYTGSQFDIGNDFNFLATIDDSAISAAEARYV